MGARDPEPGQVDGSNTARPAQKGTSGGEVLKGTLGRASRWRRVSALRQGARAEVVTEGWCQ